MDERDLLRLVEGNCSPDEAAAIQAWVAADPRRGELLDELRAVWRLTGSGTRQWDVVAARRRLLRAYNTAPIKRPASPVTSAPVPRGWRTVAAWTQRLAVAACVVAIAALLHARSRPAAEAPEREYVTAAGERATVTLVDGTRVLLSVDTRLRVARGYGTLGRGVELDGEAYFIVRHDSRSPFVVRTARGTARDLGTEFSVRAYRQEPYMQVVVATDSVELFNDAPHDSGATLLTLRPRDRAVIDRHRRVTVVANVSVEDHVAWTRGRLVFDDDAVAAVAAQLERWYDLDIDVVGPALGAERVTISFETESADEALAALAKVLDVRMTRSGRSVRLAPSNAATMRGG